MARYRDPRAGNNWVNAIADVALPADAKPRPLAELAARARRDALVISQAATPVVFLYGWTSDGAMRAVEPAKISDTEFAEGLAKQLEWLANNDQIQPNAPTLGDTQPAPAEKP